MWSQQVIDYFENYSFFKGSSSKKKAAMIVISRA